MYTCKKVTKPGYNCPLKGHVTMSDQTLEGHDLRISFWAFRVLSWVSVMKLAHGPLHVGYTKSHI